MEHSSGPISIELQPGAQAVVNGALVTALDTCRFDVSPGAYVVSGRSLWRDRRSSRAPQDELYFAVLEAAIEEHGLVEARFRLFQLLAHVVIHNRSHAAQRECSRFAAALMEGNAQEVVECAARLASHTTRSAPVRRKVPGRPGEPRQRRVTGSLLCSEVDSRSQA